MRTEFIPYEQALALKELGFDDECIAVYTTYSTVLQKYYKRGPVLSIVRQKSQFTQKTAIKAPLYQQAFQWFREKYKMFHTIIPADLGKYEDGNPNFHCGIYTNKPVDITYLLSFTNYEEAELDCLKKLIEIVKLKK